MNIRNLASKESLGVEFKDDICTGFCLKLCFDSAWYFYNMTKSDGLDSDCAETTETKLHTVAFLIPRRSLGNSGQLFSMK